MPISSAFSAMPRIRFTRPQTELSPFSQPFDQLVLLGNDQVLNGDVLVLQRVELLASVDLGHSEIQRLFCFIESIKSFVQPLLADVIAGR
jgi:hypothetical protein